MALLRALRERAPALPLHVRSEAPHWIFHERGLGLETSAAPVDPGVLQSSGLDIDRDATFAAQRDFVARFDAAVEREAAFLRGCGAGRVVGDVPPLAFEAAARAGIPAAAVANFTWAWIFGEWARQEPRWRGVADRYREAQARAGSAFRLPLHAGDDFAGMPEVIDVPLLVNRSALGRERARARLGLAAGDERRVVLVSFGGFGSGPVGSRAGEDLSGYVFVTLGADAPRLDGGDWIALGRPTPIAHEDLVQACDAIVGKAGYSTIAEALAHGTRFLHLPRENFPEVRALEAGLERHGTARAMPREDFVGGRWRAHLDALFEQPARACGLGFDGAERIAERLLSGPAA